MAAVACPTVQAPLSPPVHRSAVTVLVVHDLLERGPEGPIATGSPLSPPTKGDAFARRPYSRAVDFTLTYDGPLATNGRPAQKHDIRLRLHPQLRELWQHRPLTQFLYDRAGQTVEVGGRQFTSIVHPRWAFRAKLDILMLWPQPPGGILRSGGDIDNRLKTLFDALTRPVHAQDVPSGWDPTADEMPLECLLEDDKYISAVSVTTDRLLAAETATHVKLIIKVHVETANAFGGLAVLG